METMKIGSFEVTQQDVDVMIARMPKQQQAFAQSPAFREQVERNVRDMVMFAAWAQEIGLEESEAFKQSMEMARRDILGQMGANEALGRLEVTEDEAKAYYEEHKSEYRSQAYAGAKHILVDSEELAEEIKEMLSKQEISFEDAARKYSSCPSKEQGGDLGLFNPGQMVAEFDKAVFEGPVGELLGPVKTQFGYHLITVTELNEGDQKSFDEVKDEVSSKLLNEKRNAAYDAKIAELEAKYFG